MKLKSSIRIIAVITVLSTFAVFFSGCQKAKETNAETSSEKYTHRVLLVSDMHYTTEQSAGEYDASHPGSKASLASGNAFGYTQAEKVKAIADDISAHSERENIDAVLVLGDLSLDDYGYRNLAENYLKEFKSIFLDKLKQPWFAIAGNHDSYTDDEWKSIIGTNRQYSVKIGDAAFIMLDTFADEHAESASGSPYTGIDMKFLEEELKKYPTETIYLCAHYYKPSTSDYAFSKLLKSNSRVVCMFKGHTHENVVLSPEEMNYKCLCDIGGYAYVGDEGGDFSQFDDDWAWGYEILEWNDSETHIYHVKKPRQYTASNGVFNFVGAIEDNLTFEINNDEK